MRNQENDEENISGKENEINAERGDENKKATPADDGFKTGNKTHGLTWETPMDEQAFDSEDLGNADEDAD